MLIRILIISAIIGLFLWFKRKKDNSPKRQDTPSTPPSGQTMTLEQAKEVLGLISPYTHHDIEIAYKRTMSQVHPDKGGSNYFATQVNQAKQLLLKYK